MQNPMGKSNKNPETANWLEFTNWLEFKV